MKCIIIDEKIAIFIMLLNLAKKKVELLEYRGNSDYFFSSDFGFYYDMFCGVLIFKNKMSTYFCIFSEGLISSFQ